MIDLSNAKVGDWYLDANGNKLDLSNTKVGDEYLDANENKLECVFIASSGDFRYVFTDTKHGGFTGLYNNKGENNSHCCVDMVSKVDKRPWLKDMPDAMVFDIYGVISIQGNAQDGWFDNRGNVLSSGFMPCLSADRWKDSKISIEELREWQEVNK